MTVARLMFVGAIVLATARVGAPGRAEAEGASPPTPHVGDSSTFELPRGFEIHLVAAEPHLVNPMSLALDGRGGIYVSLAHSYRYGPAGSPVSKPTNPVVRLELDADGRVRSSTTVLTGFANPVMGLAVVENRLWLTNLNRVLVAEIEADGALGAPREVVRDAGSPWNPFGMYRIKAGRDGLMYLSVGDHATELSGPCGSVKVRGNTGAIFRFRSDGSDLEIVLQGLRAPFSFDLDPFGDLRVLSNGEGNPNRLIQAIRGADYHFQTRKASWDWLAGKDPLAPPSREMPPGANTEVVRYFSSAFPEAYRGDLLVSNWGAHGFPSANHVVLRYFVDERGELESREPECFLATHDPRFRPTQLVVDHDGSLLVLDWYGRDDENDLTGRLYRITYSAPFAERRPRASAHHDELKEVLAAAGALWAARRRFDPSDRATIEAALRHPDWRLRRLALLLLGDLGVRLDHLDALVNDPDLSVATEAAMLFDAPVARTECLLRVLRAGGARLTRLRYRAALDIARSGRRQDIDALLESTDAHLRLAGLIALDEAFHETVHGARSDDVALRTLDGSLACEARRPPGSSAIRTELLATAERWPHRELVGSITAVLLRGDLTPEDVARGTSVLRGLGLPVTEAIPGEAIDHFLADVAKRRAVLTTRQQKLATLEVLEALAAGTPSPVSRRPGPGGSEDASWRAMDILRTLLEDPEIRVRAYEVLAVVGAGQREAIDLCWRRASRREASTGERVEAIATLTRLEGEPCLEKWSRLLASESRTVAVAARRCLATRRDRPEVASLLEGEGPGREDTASSGDLRSLRSAEQATATDALRARLVRESPRGDPLLGRLAYRTHGCTSCHPSTEGGRSGLGPSLRQVAATNPLEYIVDSILHPSRVVKTGFLAETVVTRDGQVFTGKVEERGETLAVRSSGSEETIVASSNVLVREKTATSIMPEALETTMSEAELRDLIAYLATLRGTSGTDTAEAK